jgi:hypothetical protein
MSKLVLVALLLIGTGTADANTIALRHEVLARLQAANVAMEVGKNYGCAVMDLNEVVIVSCYGENRPAQYRRALEALEGLNVTNKYSALLNSGHVEVR